MRTRYRASGRRCHSTPATGQLEAIARQQGRSAGLKEVCRVHSLLNKTCTHMGWSVFGGLQGSGADVLPKLH